MTKREKKVFDRTIERAIELNLIHVNPMDPNILVIEPDPKVNKGQPFKDWEGFKDEA